MGSYYEIMMDDTTQQRLGHMVQAKSAVINNKA